MLRNTSDGKELAMPATNAYQRSIVWVDGIRYMLGYEMPEILAVG